jgi:hypothetical protein
LDPERWSLALIHHDRQHFALIHNSTFGRAFDGLAKRRISERPLPKGKGVKRGLLILMFVMFGAGTEPPRGAHLTTFPK